MNEKRASTTDDDVAISVSELGKRYRVGTREKSDSLTGAVIGTLLYPVRNFRRLTSRRKFREGEDGSIHWAIRGLDFAVHRGEVLGIIGHNGAGKSTLLKVLSRITPPTTGEVVIRGRVSSLLEVGTGFHPELTGRDNVYMNGTILGMSRQEIDEKFEEIVEFSGIRKHIETPIKFYSSGMKVRLAFSVAAHLDPEILIIDEVLAVGDLAFQQKCLGKMDEVAKGGRTVLFVSHNMVAVEGLCTRCLLMEDGRVTFAGSVPECISRYREANMDIGLGLTLAERTDREGGQRVRFTGVTFNEGQAVFTCTPVSIRLTVAADTAIADLRIAVKFSRSYREVVMTLDSHHHDARIAVAPGGNTIIIDVPDLQLIPGDYLVDLWAGSGVDCVDRIFNAARLTVGARDVYGSGLLPKANKHGFYVPPKCSWRDAGATHQ